MANPRGTFWSKWDLHVHTPDSIVQHFDYTGTDRWEAFISDLEALPPEVKVLGINDYLFIDGYERVLKYRSEGRLQNIATVLPVIELRLDKFGGSDGDLKRINFHVIFSNEVSSNIIREQFLSGLSRHYRLTSDVSGLDWAASATRQSLEDLGRRLIDSAPPEKRSQYGSALQEGFNNFTVTLDGVLDLLDNHYLRDKHVLAVGKTEWDALKWNDQSVADKKTIINTAHVVFVAASSPDHWRRCQEKLTTNDVNAKLLDCSDAHYPSGSLEKDRIGNCFTWINADTTFEGLRHAIFDYSTRVYVGEEPNQLRQVRVRPLKYMDRIAIHKEPGSNLSQNWFDVDLELNPGFVSIIGHKGKGKSALADTIGLLGFSRNQSSASFLSEARFRNPRHNLAKHFTSSLTWLTGQVITRSLNHTVRSDEIESVNYVPQSLFEEICNETPTEGTGRFDRELGEVIFSHVSPADRLGFGSLSELVLARTATVTDRLAILRSELRKINQEIVGLESRATADHRTVLESQIRVKQNEIDSLVAPPSASELKPSDDAENSARAADVLLEIERLTQEADSLAGQIRNASNQATEQARIAATATAVLDKVSNLQHVYDTFSTEVAELLSRLGIGLSTIVTFETRLDELGAQRLRAESLKAAAERSCAENVDGNLLSQLQSVQSQIQTAQDRLAEPERRYQVALRAESEWQEQIDKLVGDEETPDTLRYHQKQLRELDLLPGQLSDATNRRKGKVREIYAELQRMVDTYRSIYRPVQEFIDSHPLAKQQFMLDFDVTLVSHEFESVLLAMIDSHHSGSFAGREEGRAALSAITRKTSFDCLDQVEEFLGQIDASLHCDMRPGRGQGVTVPSQLRRSHSAEDVYQYLFGLEYLVPKFILQSHGKELAFLSPGEKGTLLLMFYLLVDRRDMPLILDQPEENLDNHTIHNLLVPAINDAKSRRQVIVVTHNPNLAVVGDADQIICAEYDTDRITYTSGAIEDPNINSLLVAVLEGTRPAFDNRVVKYAWSSSFETARSRAVAVSSDV
jgi:ABC-type lipoprotein export system ATPase subunit